MLDASDILSTPPSGARSLFEGLGGTAAGFRRLARDWHPDVNRSPRAAEVFAHLLALRTAAEAGTRPARDAVRSLRGTDGRTFEMRHLRARTFDAGEILVGRTSLAYLVAPDFDDLAEAAAKRRPAFADAAMRREMERFLPAALGAQETTSGRVLTYARAPGQVLLADLVAHLGGTVEPVHAAWITSGSVESMTSGASMPIESFFAVRAICTASSVRSVSATQTSSTCAPPSTCSRAMPSRVS